MPLSRNEPSAPLTVSRNKPLAWLVTTMGTAGKAAPCWSTTRPRRSAVPCCAMAGKAEAKTVKSRMATRTMSMPP
jgi:hypothetical protein